MSIHVIVENNNIDLALQQLGNKHYFLHTSRWYKKRYGYYEKPSVLKRKKYKMKLIVSQAQSHFAQCAPPYIHPNFWHKINLEQQHQRTGNNLAVGR